MCEGRLAGLFHEDGRIKKRHTLMWPFKNTESADLIRQLQGFRDVFVALMAADSLDVSVKSHQVAVETRSILRELKDDMASRRRDRGTQALLDWIFPEDMETWRLGGDRANWRQGTGAWFFDSTEFLDWIESKEGQKLVLWCTGPPGSGKSVLMSQAISHIQGQLSHTSCPPGAIVLSHFCDHRDSRTQSPDAIIRHLMRQAALESDAVLANLDKSKEYQNRKRNGRSLRLDELLRIFLDTCLPSDPRFLIVLDGLDECTNDLTGLEARREVLQFIAKAASSDARILTASRDLADIRAELTGCCSELKVRAPDADLELYVTGRVQGIEKRVARAENFKRAIIDKVAEDADGIVDLACKMLLWLCYTQRPLLESEIQHALATELGDNDFDLDGITPGELLQACCMGIVVCDSEGVYSLFHETAYDFFRKRPEFSSAAARRLNFPDMPVLHVLFHHAGGRSLPKSRGPRETEGRSQSARLCGQALGLCYRRLAPPVRGPGLLSPEERGKRVAADDQGWTPLISASSYGHLEIIDLLLTHAAAAAPVGEDTCIKGVETGDAEKKDVVDVAERLLAAEACASLKDESNWTPIDWAAFRADVDWSLVALLVQYTSLPEGHKYTPYDETDELCCPEGFSAIFLEAAAGDNQTVEKLLQRGTTVPLGAGVPTGMKSVLYKSGRNIKDRYHSGGEKRHDWISIPSVMLSVSFTIRLFESAIRFDQLAIIKMLVELGSPLGAVKGESASISSPRALIHRCETETGIHRWIWPSRWQQYHAPGCSSECLNPNSKAVSGLIEDGSAPAVFMYGLNDLNSGSYRYDDWENKVRNQLEDPHLRRDSLPAWNNAKDVKIYHDNEGDDDGAFEVLRGLLGRGCDTNATVPSGYSCYYILVVSLDVVRILVQGGADVNAINEKNRSVLLETCFEAPAEVVRFLIASGAHIDTYDNLKRNPLHIICDPEVLTRDSYYDDSRKLRVTVLDYAMEAGNWAAVDLLRSRGARPRNPSIVSRTLRKHTTNPRGDIFRRLVSEFGADITKS
ncbi:ankyrin repeat-containing domain protein [Apiospora phragmitis]|uniref:Ankyrin repeat-containing domain protein n=1 Tax=Apiospora phragmitis TaxID=2905665 RepID=A0ABR1W163_9PEZI